MRNNDREPSRPASASSPLRPKPVIGISTGTAVRPGWSEYEPEVLADHVLRCFSDEVVEAGGLPVYLPTVGTDELADALIAEIDGLILSGGGDVAPDLYNDQPHPRLGQVDRARDRFEMALVRRAVDRGRPILAVCRGIQVLNVALGGNLYQDLSSEREGGIQHHQKAPHDVATHRVWIDENSRLHQITGQKQPMVNSRHHQAVKDIADHLVRAATAPDGVVEAVEHVEAAFVIGVQWHPESLADETSRRLFAALVEAAGR